MALPKMEANEIVELTGQIRNAIAGLALPESKRREIAFHLADVVGDVPAILYFVSIAKRGDKATQDDLLDLMRIVTIHWPYHQKALRALGRYVHEFKGRPTKKRSGRQLRRGRTASRSKPGS